MKTIKIATEPTAEHAGAVATSLVDQLVTRGVKDMFESICVFAKRVNRTMATYSANYSYNHHTRAFDLLTAIGVDTEFSALMHDKEFREVMTQHVANNIVNHGWLMGPFYCLNWSPEECDIINAARKRCSTNTAEDVVEEGLL